MPGCVWFRSLSSSGTASAASGPMSLKALAAAVLLAAGFGSRNSSRQDRHEAACPDPQPGPARWPPGRVAPCRSSPAEAARPDAAMLPAAERAGPVPGSCVKSWRCRSATPCTTPPRWREKRGFGEVSCRTTCPWNRSSSRSPPDSVHSFSVKTGNAVSVSSPRRHKHQRGAAADLRVPVVQRLAKQRCRCRQGCLQVVFQNVSRM